MPMAFAGDGAPLSPGQRGRNGDETRGRETESPAQGPNPERGIVLHQLPRLDSNQRPDG